MSNRFSARVGVAWRSRLAAAGYGESGHICGVRAVLAHHASPGRPVVYWRNQRGVKQVPIIVGGASSLPGGDEQRAVASKPAVIASRRRIMQCEASARLSRDHKRRRGNEAATAVSHRRIRAARVYGRYLHVGPGYYKLTCREGSSAARVTFLHGRKAWPVGNASSWRRRRRQHFVARKAIKKPRKPRPIKRA